MGDRDKDKRDASRGRRGKREPSRSRRSRSNHRGRQASRSRSGRRQAAAPKDEKQRRRSRSRRREKDGFEPRPRETPAASAPLPVSAPAVSLALAPVSAVSAAAPAAAAAPRAGLRIQSFEEILEQVRTGAAPFQMPVLAGSALRGGCGGGLRLPAKPLNDMYRPGWAGRNDVAPTASAEVLRDAKEKAKKVEDQGLETLRRTGQAPRGPPAAPTGTMVVEQRFVDFIVGPGGQSLAALNYAAGVTVHLDQTPKYAGYSVAHIYGPEDCVRRAKLALEFKISQWLPRGVSYSSTPSAPTFSTGDVPAASSSSPAPSAPAAPVTSGML